MSLFEQWHGRHLAGDQQNTPVEPPVPHEDDYEPYTPVGEVPADGTAKSLLHRVDELATPIFDKVQREQRQATKFADDVEQWLKARSGGAL